MELFKGLGEISRILEKLENRERFGKTCLDGEKILERKLREFCERFEGK